MPSSSQSHPTVCVEPVPSPAGDILCVCQLVARELGSIFIWLGTQISSFRKSLPPQTSLWGVVCAASVADRMLWKAVEACSRGVVLFPHLPSSQRHVQTGNGKALTSVEDLSHLLWDSPMSLMPSIFLLLCIPPWVSP